MQLIEDAAVVLDDAADVLDDAIGLAGRRGDSSETDVLDDAVGLSGETAQRCHQSLRQGHNVNHIFSYGQPKGELPSLPTRSPYPLTDAHILPPLPPPWLAPTLSTSCTLMHRSSWKRNSRTFREMLSTMFLLNTLLGMTYTSRSKLWGR